MKRRSGGGGVRGKSRGRKATAQRRRNAPKTMRNRGVSVAGQETAVARLTRERDEALLREAANSEILHLISKSAGDLELVFQTILEDATRICNAKFGTLFRFDGSAFHLAAQFGKPPKHAEFQRRRGPFLPTPGSHLDRVMRTKRVSSTADRTSPPRPSLPLRIRGY